MFYHHLFCLIETPNNRKLLEDLGEIVYKIGKNAFDNSNRELCLFVLSMFDIIIEKCGNKDLISIISSHKYNLSLKAIYFNNDLSALFFPDYNEEIQTSATIDDIKSVIDKYEELLYRTALRKNTELTLYFLNEINQIASRFSKEKKLEQIEFINLYEYLIDLTIKIKSNEVFQIALHKFIDLIITMDKENNISIDLFKTILEKFDDASDKAIREKQIDLSLSINSNLGELIKKLNILAKHREMYFEANEVIFQTGVKGVENNIEEVIRHVSNHLGWACKTAIDNNEMDKVKWLLVKASKLYNLTVDFGVKENTVIFVGTLFIVLGGYCTSKNNLTGLAMLIATIKGLKKVEVLNKSRIIREYESATWNKYMKNDAQGNIESFWKKVNDVKK